jgi:hypothetical protein
LLSLGRRSFIRRVVMKRTDAEKTKEALTEALAGLKSCYESGCTYNRTRTYIADVMTRVAAILAPDPIETEEVPVERWGCLQCGDMYSTEIDTCPERDGHDIVKLTGTHKVEKKQPVVKSVSGPVSWEMHNGFAVPLSADRPIIYFRDLLDKRGTLTFTYEEPAA